MIDISELRRLEAEARASEGKYPPWSSLNTHEYALYVAMRNALPELLSQHEQLIERVLRYATDYVPRKPLEWQPIETAPKDGTNILVHSPEGEQVAWWSEGWNKFLTTGGGDDLWDEPTNWMPLPLPPHGGGDVG